VKSEWRGLWTSSRVQRPDRATCGVGCHHLPRSAGEMPHTEVIAAGSLWSMVDGRWSMVDGQGGECACEKYAGRVVAH
jgi:hypothetical protein